MTLEEMEAAGKRAEQIRRAISRLREAEGNLACLKKIAAERKSGKATHFSWCPELVLKKAESSYSRNVTVQVEIPYGVVEQQLVYAVDRARREVYALGGQP